MNSNTVKLSSEFESACSISGLSGTTHKIVETSQKIARSSSLDTNYIYSDHHTKDDGDSFKKTTLSALPISGYHTDEEYNDGDEDDEIYQPIIRSYTVGSKGASNQKALLNTWKFIANNHDTYPDMSHASKKAPILGSQEFRITNSLGSIGAIAISDSLIVVGTLQYNIQVFDIHESNHNESPSVILSHGDLVPSLDTSSANTSSSSLPTSDTDIIRSICFSPAVYAGQQQVVWAGTENGSILVCDVKTNAVLGKRMATHGSRITFILRNRHSELWTLDVEGNLCIWKNIKTTNKDVYTSDIDLHSSPQQFNVAADARSAILSTLHHFLWLASGDFIYRFDRSNCSQSSILAKDVFHLFTLQSHPSEIFGINTDGEIASWDESTLEPKKRFMIAREKCCSVLSTGDALLWLGFENGMITIFDTRPDPWVAIKVWRAHRRPVCKMVLDEFCITETMPVVSMDMSGNIAVWDGLLGQHWLEEQVLKRKSDYCEFNELKVMICSWNLDAIKPESLTESDVKNLEEWIHGMEDPDVISIGMQEIANLSSTTLTVKSILTSNKRIDTIEQADGLLTHRYMLWYNYFAELLDKTFGPEVYVTAKTDQLVGLFSCVFVKKSVESRIKQIESSAVKTGFRVMNKGLHGNKGGVAIRLVIDDSSICFINCHLAAGQSYVLARNNDIEGIIYSAKFPVYTKEKWLQQTIFKKDVDGSCVLDHEVCFLYGDLNYRVNLDREQVMGLLEGETKLESWETLQLSDQLKQEQAGNPLFRLIGFKEAPLLFDPTYKYDKGTSTYDTSEKKRVPAWCDRILYRAATKTNNLYYKRHEILVSDHRPISAGFDVAIKTINHSKLKSVRATMSLEWKEIVATNLKRKKLNYVLKYGICDESEASRRLDSLNWDVQQVVHKLHIDKGYSTLYEIN